MVGDAHHVAGEGLVGDLAVAGKEELGGVQGDQLARPHLLQAHPALQPAGAHTGERDAVAVVGVHVGLYLEHQGGQLVLGRMDDAAIGGLVTRRRAEGDQAVQQVGHADLAYGAAKEHGRQRACVELGQVELRQGRAHQVQLVAQCRHAGVGLVQRLGEVHVAGAEVVGAGERGSAADGPGDGGGVQRQGLRHLVQRLERVTGFAVHLVDERQDGDVAQAANLEQLSRPRLDALGGVNHHHSRVHGGQRAVGVLREVLVARRVQEVEHAAAILERHHGGDDGDAALAFDAHPVGPGAAALALGADVAGQLDGPARTQQALRERSLAGVGVGDDGERAPAGDFLGRGSWELPSPSPFGRGPG